MLQYANLKTKKVDFRAGIKAWGKIRCKFLFGEQILHRCNSWLIFTPYEKFLTVLSGNPDTSYLSASQNFRIRIMSMNRTQISDPVLAMGCWHHTHIWCDRTSNLDSSHFKTGVLSWYAEFCPGSRTLFDAKLRVRVYENALWAQSIQQVSTQSV